jgi:hypothetical protein
LPRPPPVRILSRVEPQPSGATSPSLPTSTLWPGQRQDPRPASHERNDPGHRSSEGGVPFRELHGPGHQLQRLRDRLRLFRVGAGVLRREGVRLGTEAMLRLPRPAASVRWRRWRRWRRIRIRRREQRVCVRQRLRWRRRVWRPARDARRHVCALWEPDSGPVSADGSAPRVLLRLLPDDARLGGSPSLDATGGPVAAPFRACADGLARSATGPRTRRIMTTPVVRQTTCGAAIHDLRATGMA